MKILFTIMIISLVTVANAQHSQHTMMGMDMPMGKRDTVAGKDTMPMSHPMGHTHRMHSMTSAYSLSLPMNRNGSGTGWQPDNTPMYMLMKHGQKDMWMFHGSVFLRYNNQQLTQQTSRSGTSVDAPNWMMAMYNRQVGKNGLFSFSGMFSLDALTVGKGGYPLLFQSGEAYKGVPLVDKQHPHDLFSELSVSYSQRLSRKVDVFGYFGYPDEPALGPVAFMHRNSAMNDPDAPLGHHWQDATHITFGVATLGIRLDKVLLEASSFTGREPDENRYDFDRMHFDSYSWRVSYNPVAAWSFQVSQGYIQSPEVLRPSENVWRYTASASYATPVSETGQYFTGSLVWGMNDEGNGHREQSVLLEATRQLPKQAVYGRYEFVQKSSEELNLESLYGDTRFDIHKLTLGTNHQLWELSGFNLLVGAQVSLNVAPASLQPLYGKLPMAGEIYLQVRPRLSKM